MSHNTRHVNSAKRESKTNQPRASGKKWSSNHRSSHSHSQSASRHHHEDSETTRLMHDRMLFLLANLVGSVVQVTVKNGTKYEGVLHGASTENNLGVTLKLAQKLQDSATPAPATSKGSPDETKRSSPYIKSLIIPGKELVEVSCVDTDLTAGDADVDTFKTDTDISGRMEIKERELHKWAPEAQGEGAPMFSALEEESALSAPGPWDQFAVNEQLFGLTTDFDEELYTTRLDRSAPDYKDRERWAIEKANEIQKSAATNVHVMEERGILMDDSGMDEEDRYGAVVRDQAPNRYTPPALRNKLYGESKMEIVATTTATVAGSDITTGMDILHKLKTDSLPGSGGPARSPVAQLSTARNHSKEKKNTEGDLRGVKSEVADQFRQFAMQEKGKLHAKKEEIKKKEIDNLVEFGRKFKLDFPAPTDIHPLLSSATRKSPTTSHESSPQTENEEQHTEPPVASVINETSKQEEPANPPKSKSGKPGFKFNVKAMEFKPNPSAAAFVPKTKTGTSAEDRSSSSPNRFPKITEHITIAQTFKPPFSKGKEPISPKSIGPRWPFGKKQYRLMFNQYAPYEDDMYAGYGSPGFAYGYAPYYPPQFVQGIPPMPQPGYMNSPFMQGVPFSTATMPHGSAPGVTYSPQMTNASPHGSPYLHSYSSPQRSSPAPVGVYTAPYQGPLMIPVPTAMPVIDPNPSQNSPSFPCPTNQEPPQTASEPENH
ncbi:LsmAD domain-containing protein [Dichotomocladium elegans]|nr:LsmAD domain-containing protein [Dichotomocladium elegans]